MSASSPATGARTKGKRARADDGARDREADEPGDDVDDDADVDAAPAAEVEIGLEHARGQHLRWVLIGGVIGALCVILLGTLGKALGVVLLAMGGLAGYRLTRTYLYPPGTIVIERERVSLPPGLCARAAVGFDRAQVTSAYFLRRAVPWTRAAPVLIIEVDGRAFSYPRDWFASEADQRRILDALVGAP